MLHANVKKKKCCIWKESRLKQRRSQQLKVRKLCFGLDFQILRFLHLLSLSCNTLFYSPQKRQKQQGVEEAVLKPEVVLVVKPKIFRQNTSVLFCLPGKLWGSKDEFSFSVIFYDFHSHQELESWKGLTLMIYCPSVLVVFGWGRRNFDNHKIFLSASHVLPHIPGWVREHQNHSGGREDVETCCLILLGQQLLLQEGLWHIWPCSLLKNYGKRLKCLTSV